MAEAGRIARGVLLFGLGWLATLAKVIPSETRKRQLELKVMKFVEKRGEPVADGEVVDAIAHQAKAPEEQVIDAVRRLVDWRKLRFNNSWLLEKGLP